MLNKNIYILCGLPRLLLPFINFHTNLENPCLTIFKGYKNPSNVSLADQVWISKKLQICSADCNCIPQLGAQMHNANRDREKGRKRVGERERE